MPQLTGVSFELSEMLAISVHASKVPEHARRALHVGQRLSRVKGRGIDLDEVRVYQPGDDVRYIDWKVTARKRTPHTKVFRVERERPTLLVVDQTPTMFFGSKLRLKSVAAAEIATRIAWQTIAMKDRVGGCVIGTQETQVFKPKRNSRTVALFFDAIRNANNALVNSSLDESHNRQRQSPWLLLSQRVRRIAKANHRIVLISDFLTLTSDALTRLAMLSRPNSVQFFMVFDEMEHHLPPANTYSVTDGTSQMLFDSSNTANCSIYSARFEARVDKLQSFCRTHQIGFKRFSTSESFEKRRLDE